MATKAQTKKGDKIAAFVSQYSNKGTGNNYRNACESFLRCINDLPRKAPDGSKATYDYESLFDAYLTDKNRDHNKDMEKFAGCLKEECVSLLSARQIMTYARCILEEYGATVRKSTIRTLKRELKGGAGTVDKVMTAKVIDAALKELDVKGRAIVLTLASSGARLNEILSLKLSDVDFESNPVKLTIRHTKNKQPRYSFISTEAARSVKAWMAKRDDYLKGAAGRNAGLVRAGKSKEKTTDTPYVFPISDASVIAMWENALKAAGLYSADEETGRNQYRLHSLRKFFISQMSMAGQKVLAEHLAGHLGYLDASYRQVDSEQAGTEYLKVQHVVTIGIPPEFREKAAELSGTLKLQGESIDGLRGMNEKLSAQMAKIQEENTALQERSQQFEQALEEQKNNFNLLVDLFGALALEFADQTKNPRMGKEVREMLDKYKANPYSAT
jgi:integrase